MGGAGILCVAFDEGILALEEGEGLLVLGEVGGCLTVLTEAGEVEAHLVEHVSFAGKIEEMGRVSAIVNKFQCESSSGGSEPTLSHSLVLAYFKPPQS